MKKLSILLALLLTADLYAATPLQTLEFYKQQLETLPAATTRAEKDWAKALADDLGTWARQNAKDEHAPQALLSQARLYLQAQEKADALIALLTVKYNYEQTNLTPYKSLITEAIVDLDKNTRQTAEQIFQQPALPAQNDTEKAANLLFALSKLSGKTFYAPATAQFENFFVQYPTYEKNDQVELWYGDLHRLNGNYLAAIMQYKKAAALYPDTPYRAASLRLIGDIYADNLKDTPSAMAIYTQVLHDYPNSNETGVVYKHMAMLAENNKNFDEALINYNKAIELLGNTPAAYEAYIGKADVYAKTRDYAKAYDALIQTAAAYENDSAKHTDALLKAAQIAKKNLRDTTKYTQALERALLKYPQNSKAPQLMYDLGQTYEKQGKSLQAAAIYRKLILAHPEDRYASKAQGRLSRLENTK